jgi:hypothetical protein
VKDVVRTDRREEFYEDEDGEGLKMLENILTTYMWKNYDLGM